MEVKLGEYEHFKGNKYEVIGIARHSETLEEMVVYRGLHNCQEFGNNPIWVRPKYMFLETVEMNGQQIPRFKYIG